MQVGLFGSYRFRLAVSVDGTHLFGATEIRSFFGEIRGAHISEASALWLHSMVALTTGDTIELQGNFRAADGYFTANHTSFRGAKIG